MTINLKNFVELIVPEYLIIVLITPISSYLIINESIPPVTFLLPIFSLSFAVMGFNTINMIFDVEIDKIDKPRRPLPNGKVKLMEVLYLSILLFLFSLIIAFFVNNLFLMVMLVFIFLAYCYSAPFPYLKKYWWASSFIGTVLYGMIPFLAAVSVSKNDTPPIVFLFFFAGLFAIISNVKDVEDMVGEEKHGIASIPLFIGVKATAIIIIIMPLALTIFMGILAILNLIPQKFLHASVISSLILLVSAGSVWRETKKVEYRNIIFKELKNDEIKDIITQSNAVTITVSTIVIVQLIFGVIALI